MKKVVYIAALVMVVVSCQKEDIRPTVTPSTTTTPMPLKSGSGDDVTGTIGTTTGGDDTSSGDDTDEGDITDPMKKKDRKE